MAAGHDHLGALPGEGDGGGAADAGESAGNQNNSRTHSAISRWARGRSDPRPDQTWDRPPSTNSSMPVTKLESSDARNSAALATSSACPIRPIGMLDTSLAMMSAG